MNYSFAITTDYKNKEQLKQVVESIRSLNIPNYEILIVGGEKEPSVYTVYEFVVVV